MKRLILLLSLVIIIGITGCAQKNDSKTTQNNTKIDEKVEDQKETTKKDSEDKDSEEKESQEKTSEDNKKDTKTIIDHLGYEVEVPTKIERIIIDGIFPLPSTYALFEGNVDKIVGMEPASLSAAKGSLLEDMFPDIVSVPTEFADGEDVNIEELLEQKPDVIFYRAETKGVRDKLVATGLPVVAFSTAKFKFNTIDTFNGWITLLGDVLSQEDKAAGIVEKARESYNQVQKVLEQVADKDKKRILMINKYDENQLKIYGGKHFAQFWIESSGGINVGQDIKGSMVEVNMEQIYEFNPDIIFITNFTDCMPEDILNNAINSDDWSGIKAVQDKQVYKFPLGVYRWYPPSSDVALVFKWLASKNYPELFKDMDMKQEAINYYKELFNLDVSEEKIEKVFNPSRDAGRY